jgi:acyl carrier protein
MDVRKMLSQAMELPASKLGGIDRLSELERWDSLAILNFMALADSHLGVALAPDQIVECQSISDLEALVERAHSIGNESVHQIN